MLYYLEKYSPIISVIVITGILIYDCYKEFNLPDDDKLD